MLPFPVYFVYVILCYIAAPVRSPLRGLPSLFCDRPLGSFYGAQNEAYRMTEGRKMGEVVSLQTVRRSLMVEAPQNETFT